MQNFLIKKEFTIYHSTCFDFNCKNNENIFSGFNLQ